MKIGIFDFTGFMFLLNNKHRILTRDFSEEISKLKELKKDLKEIWK